MRTFRPASCLLSLTFSIQYPLGPGKTQNSSSERMLPLVLVGLHVF